jgi:hypothetical protein
MGLIVFATNLLSLLNSATLAVCNLLFNVSLILCMLQLLKFLLHLECFFLARYLVKEEFLLGLFLLPKLKQLVLQSLLCV